jgi:hypothetical protein
MNRSNQRGFDLHAIPKYPWEDGEEWDQRRARKIEELR